MGARVIEAAVRNGIAVLLLASSLLSPLRATPEFSGSLETRATANVPQDGVYDASPLNLGNQLGVEDFNWLNQFDVKLSDKGETTKLELWLFLANYPIGEIIQGSASIADAYFGGGLTNYADAVGGLFVLSPSYIFTLGLMRASINWQPADFFGLTLGRQSFLTGYGYGWNPLDLVNPTKDPSRPNAAAQGVDALSLRLSPAEWLDMKFYGAMPSIKPSASYVSLVAGTELSLIFEKFEMKLAGLWGGKDQGRDPLSGQYLWPHALSAGFYLDLWGLGFYGEAAMRSRSRRNSPDPASLGTRLVDGPVFNTVVGFEYYFEAGPSIVLEYYYNGEGWDDGQRHDFSSILASRSSGPSVSDIALYQPTHFAQHYILFNLALPIYSIESNINLNVIYSPDSQALLLTPSVELGLGEEGNLNANFSYSGLIDLEPSNKNEAYLSPVKHSFSAGLTYFF